jgi:hypothetical protein
MGKVSRSLIMSFAYLAACGAGCAGHAASDAEPGDDAGSIQDASPARDGALPDSQAQQDALDAPLDGKGGASDAGGGSGGNAGTSSGKSGASGSGGGGGAGGVAPECTPGQQKSLGGCGLCGSNVQTCDANGKWGVAACVNQGVCSPGTTSSGGCGNCGRGTHSRTCSSSCQWGAYGSCQNQPCSPGSTRSSGSCGCGGTQRQTCNSSCNYVNSSCDGSETCNANQVCSGGNCVCRPGKCGSACDGTLVGSVCCSYACTQGNCAACVPGCFC